MVIRRLEVEARKKDISEWLDNLRKVWQVAVKGLYILIRSCLMSCLIVQLK